MLEYEGLKFNIKKAKFFYRLWLKGKIKVTRSGRVFNIKTGNELGHVDTTGYKKVSWKDNNKIYSIPLHVIVWLVYGDKKPNKTKFVVNHKDGNRMRCGIKNLELTTNRGNIKHAKLNGLVPSNKGEKNGQAKFKNKEVIYYRNLFAKGKITVEKISKKYKMPIVCVRAMLKGKTYSSLGGVLANFGRGGRKVKVYRKNTISTIKTMRMNNKSDYYIANKLSLSRIEVYRIRKRLKII